MEIAMSAPVPAETAKPQPWYRKLWVHVLLATALGAALGHFAPDLGTRLQPLGDVFIKAIRVVIAPLIFCTIVHGIAHIADMSKVGRVAVRTLIYFELVTTVALAIGLVAVNLFQPGAGMNIDASKIDTSTISGVLAKSQHTDVVSFLTDVIPQSFVGAFTDGSVLQVLFIAVLCGFALTKLGRAGAPVLNLIEAISNLLFGLVNIIMWAAPFGAFGAMAFTVGKFGAGSLVSLGYLLGSFYATCIFFILAVLWPIAHVSGFSLFKLLRYIREEVLIAFATTSSETVLPRLLAKMKNLGCEEGVVGLVVPSGYSFNLDGTCLYLASASMFLAQATNTHLSLGDQLGLMAVLLLTSKGAAGISGAAFVVLAATLSTTGTIPVASVALVLGIHRLMSEGLTPTNLVGNAVATIVMAKWEGALDTDRMQQVLDRRIEADS